MAGATAGASQTTDKIGDRKGPALRQAQAADRRPRPAPRRVRAGDKRWLIDCIRRYTMSNWGGVPEEHPYRTGSVPILTKSMSAIYPKLITSRVTMLTTHEGGTKEGMRAHQNLPVIYDHNPLGNSGKWKPYGRTRRRPARAGRYLDPWKKDDPS